MTRPPTEAAPVTLRFWAVWCTRLYDLVHDIGLVVLDGLIRKPGPGLRHFKHGDPSVRVGQFGSYAEAFGGVTLVLVAWRHFHKPLFLGRQTLAAMQTKSPLPRSTQGGSGDH